MVFMENHLYVIELEKLLKEASRDKEEIITAEIRFRRKSFI